MHTHALQFQKAETLGLKREYIFGSLTDEQLDELHAIYEEAEKRGMLDWPETQARLKEKMRELMV